MPKRKGGKRKKPWEWFTRITVVVAFVLSLIAAFTAYRKSRAEKEFQVREIYNKAWDALGGAKGTAAIEQDVLLGNPSARQAAMNLVNEGLAIAPDDADLLATKGFILAEEGNVQEAEKLYRLALANKPRDVVAHNGLGVLLQDQGKPNEAIAIYEQAIALNPDDLWIVYYNLGSAFEEAKRFREAESALRKAISLRRDFVEAHERLANVLEAQHRAPEAKIAREKAKSLSAQVQATSKTAALQP